MYNKFFHFKEKPFQLAPNPEYLFLSKNHGKALTDLIFTITQSKESVLVTGEKGTGKTILCKALFDNLDESIKAAYISTPKMDALQLLKAISDEFWIDSTPDNTKEDLIDKLNGFLIKKKAAGQKVVILIDEAQNLHHDALEQILQLSNLESTQGKPVQIILVGLPELNDILSSDQFKKLGQRITKNCQLVPLSFLETTNYIEHRISLACQKTGRPPFDKASCRVIYDYSKGIPLLINISCEMALQNAFNHNSFGITGAIAREAIKKLTQEKPDEPGSKSKKIPGLAILLAVLVPMVIMVLYFTKEQLPETTVSGEFVEKIKVPASSGPIDSAVDKLEIPEKTLAISQSDLGEKSSESRDVYSVHVGSFWTAPEANLVLNNMKSLGFPSFMYISLSKKGNTVYVVVAGKYQSHDLAKEASENLTQKGHSNFIAKAKGSLRIPANAAPISSAVDKLEVTEKPLAVNQAEPGEKSSESRDVYSVHVGTFMTASQANMILNELKSLGFPSFMYSKTGKKVDTVYVVVAGKYPSQDLAKEASRTLSKKGHDNFIAKAKNSLKEGPTK